MQNNEIQILLICEEKSLPQYLNKIFSNQWNDKFAFKLEHFTEFKKALSYLNETPVDVVIYEHQKTANITKSLSELNVQKSDVPIIVLTEIENEHLIKKALKSGAHDCLPKTPENLQKLNHLIIRSVGLKYLNKIEESQAANEPPPGETAPLTSFFEGKPIIEQQFQNIINISVETIIVINQNNIIQYANKSIQKILGWPLNKTIGRPLLIPILGLESKDFSSQPRNLNIQFVRFLAQTSEIFELTIPNAKEEPRIMQVRVSEMPWDHEKCYLIALHDITEIKRVATLTAEIEQKSRADKLKDEFISIVSHEMRTPLTIIKGAISNLKEGIVGPVTEPQIVTLDTTLRNVNRLARIINDLLDLSRLDSGKAVVHRRKLEIAPVVNDCIQNFAESAAKQNIQIVSEIPEGMPPVFADADMVVQVLTNLIQNALRYAKTTIKIQAINENITPKSPTDFEPTTEMLRIGVIDDGPGIPKEKQNLLFSKFEQLDRPTGGSGYKGTGLGLTICKQIIALHHGKIWVDSHLGKETRFFFLLPQYHENDDFVAGLETLLQKADKSESSLGILVLRIANLSQIMENATERNLAWMISDISKILRNKALRKTDFYHFKRDTREFIIILADTNREAAEMICKRVQSATKDCSCQGKTGKINANLKVGMAIYPDDAKRPGLLLKTAYKEIH